MHSARDQFFLNMDLYFSSCDCASFHGPALSDISLSVAHQDVDEVTVNGHTFLGIISADNLLFLAAAADLMMILPADDVGLAGAEAAKPEPSAVHGPATRRRRLRENVCQKKTRSAGLLHNMNYLSDQCEVRPLRHDSSER